MPCVRGLLPPGRVVVANLQQQPDCADNNLVVVVVVLLQMLQMPKHLEINIIAIYVVSMLYRTQTGGLHDESIKRWTLVADFAASLATVAAPAEPIASAATAAETLAWSTFVRSADRRPRRRRRPWCCRCCGS